MNPVVTIANGQLNVQVGLWGYSFDFIDVKEKLHQLSRNNRQDHTHDEVLTAIAREILRQGVDPRTLTNGQIRTLIQGMEF